MPGPSSATSIRARRGPHSTETSIRRPAGENLIDSVDNAEKNCISNVRGIGIKPREAADLTVNIIRRAFELGGGGVAIGFGFGRT